MIVESEGIIAGIAGAYFGAVLAKERLICG
jgi:hypothetical protein